MRGKGFNVSIAGRVIGTVYESSVSLARCAALSVFGVSDEDVFDAGGDRTQFPAASIFSDTDFDVIEA